MKNALIALAALLIMTTSAVAEESWYPPFNKAKPVKIPTGYEVKGCKDYYIKDGRVYNVCKKQFGERWWWFDALPHSG